MDGQHRGRGIAKSPTMVGDCNLNSEGNWKTVQNTCLGITLVKGGRGGRLFIPIYSTVIG